MYRELFKQKQAEATAGIAQPAIKKIASEEGL
jgi:hypothetical protein